MLDEVKELMEENVWGAHSLYDRGSWKQEVLEGDTQLGYWEWVSHKIESHQ
jgi:hypothetical protein